MVRRPGFEPGALALKGRCSAIELVAHMVMPPGLEPGISGLKGRRLSQFDYGTMLRPLPGGLCDYTELGPLPKRQDIINGHAKDRCEHYDVVERRHGVAALPLVNGLRRGEPEDILQIPH